MNRIQLAQYSLIASAFVIAALIIFQASQQADNQAYGAMVFSGDVVTMLTAAQDEDNEIIYTLDNRQQILTVHALDINRGGAILLIGKLDLGQEFSTGSSAGGSSTRRRSR